MLSLLVFIIIISILIIVHEFGHFIGARLSGVKVEKFAIGFGPPFLTWQGKETKVLICLFPLGGYVKLAGDDRAECKGRVFEFLSKPVRIKMGIVFAGPLFNYILAFLLLWCVSFIGLPYPDCVVGEVLKDYPAYAAGIQLGDRIVEVSGKRVESWPEMTKIIYKSKHTISMTIERDGQMLSLTVPLKEREIADDFGKKRNVSVIGIAHDPKRFKIIKYNFFRAFTKGLETLFNLTVLFLKGLFFTILGIVPLRDAATGPLGIYIITQEVVKLGISYLLFHLAVLSLSLSLVNLIPLPLFDGGHLFLFLIEKLRKRPLSEQAENILVKAGFAIIGLLVLVVFYNDIVKFGPKMTLWRK